MDGTPDIERQGDNYITDSALEAETVGFPEDGYDPHGLGGMTKDALAERLDEIQVELAEQHRQQRHWATFGLGISWGITGERLVGEAEWIEHALRGWR